MKIKFCGAATSVTGSCHLISTENHKVLLDCGQFQGNKAMEAMNWAEFGFVPSEVDCVILSHAHIDHCGRLPLLVKRGFKGKIYCTDATADLVEVMLKDSGYIHEKDAEWQSKKNARTGKPPVEPLFTYNDALDTLQYITPVLYDQLIEINDEMKIVFNDAGHILGSAITELWVKERLESGEERTSKIVFTGDLGVMDRPILRNPTLIKKADYVIMETTYGNRDHEKNSTSIKELMNILVKTVKRGGTVIIPSFAVGRTQELIFELNRVYDNNNEYKELLKDVKVYVDSPMATTATQVFQKNAQVFDEETQAYLMQGDNPLDFKNLKFTRTSQESQMLNVDTSPKIIISASGMCEAGRIRHHLKHGLWNAKNSVVFVGYQANGTLGRSLVDGAKEVSIFGEPIMVGAEIYNLEGFSGHADREGLISWLRGLQKQPKDIFLVHGELESKEGFAQLVKERLGWETTVIREVSEFTLDQETTLNETFASAEAEFADDEQVEKTKVRIAKIHDGLEQILYNTQLAVNQNISPERMVEINNLVMALEKATMNLSSTVTLEDRGNESKPEE
ncbi:MAG: MBL fold metallo-hydrolase [Firmicutes bacterium]|nr:MBL fold metallo-hydrolase [Bacillota bacterium]